ncbi:MULTISPECIES: DUF502 domain-containing protein [unclassified Arcicella]|uniref:DUF502 domain-containing protein n=1 Tax=unclassified Arcicella TaxID=2644986 RepID=UPI00285487E0|nr:MULTISPECIES: DUF502 domain-containing protein [unclassified Arcicella]MDR6562643.1 putative membrane protein [Arcicella sp. BE51]MDR6812730.1 putative membrane protein [Arcicella sp. BE140]MDR6824042.1 putative membrane protein [Arcicella sp. BE139]
MSFRIKRITAKLFSYFVKGLFLLAPVYITGYIIFNLLNSLDQEFYFYFRGTGLVIMVAIIMIVGFLGSTFISLPLIQILEEGVSKLPLVGLIYFSLKDLIGAFVGDKKKFNQPVKIIFNKENGIQKLGFITQTDLSFLDIQDSVIVYCPHSYAFSGEVFIVPSANITLLNLPASDVMKMIVSGGVSLASNP